MRTVNSRWLPLLLVGVTGFGVVGCDPIGRRQVGRASDRMALDEGVSATENDGSAAVSSVDDGAGCQGSSCYTIYAHSDHVLYKIDLTNRALVKVGAFNAPMVKVNGRLYEDNMTDLAVAPDDTLYTISHTTLYSANASDGHVTAIGNITTCGQDNVALTTTKDGNLFVADYLKGAFCKIDLAGQTPTVAPIGTLGGGYAVSGDLVAVGDGTMYATVHDPRVSKTDDNNVLVKIDPTTGVATAIIGPTGYPKLFGVAFENGQVFGFTHDGSGNVVTIDPKTGKGRFYNSFKDPSTGMGISFSGAGVNSLVAPADPG